MNLTALADWQEFGLGLPPAECLLGFQNARSPLLAKSGGPELQTPKFGRTDKTWPF